MRLSADMAFCIVLAMRAIDTGSENRHVAQMCKVRRGVPQRRRDCGMRCGIEPRQDVAQIFQRVAAQHGMPGFGHIENCAAPVCCMALAGQKTHFNQRFDCLRGRSARGRVIAGKGRGSARQAAGACEIAQRHPLRCRQPSGCRALAQARQMHDQIGKIRCWGRDVRFDAHVLRDSRRSGR